MASFDEVGRALRDDAAANAPRASAIDVDAVTRAARARRRPRQWALGTLSVVAVLGLGGLAVAAATPPVLIAASESVANLESSEADEVLAEPGAAGGSPERVDALLPCGAVPPQEYSDRLVKLSVLSPLSGSSIDSEFVGVAQLTNTGSGSLTLIVPAEANGVLVRDGVVVSQAPQSDSEPRPFELESGSSRTVPVRISTIDCRNGLALSGYSDVVVVMDVTVGSTGETLPLVAAPITVRLD